MANTRVLGTRIGIGDEEWVEEDLGGLGRRLERMVRTVGRRNGRDGTRACFSACVCACVEWKGRVKGTGWWNRLGGKDDGGGAEDWEGLTEDLGAKDCGGGIDV